MRNSEQVPGPFEIDAILQQMQLIAVLCEPSLEVGLLALSLGMAKTARHRFPVGDYPGIGSKDQIWEARNRGHTLQQHSDSPLQRLHQSVPLSNGPLVIDRVRPVHPWVDL